MLLEKWGPEPVVAAPAPLPVTTNNAPSSCPPGMETNKTFWSEKLINYYKVRNPAQATPEQVDTVMAKFQTVGYPKMWEMLQEKYGKDPGSASSAPEGTKEHWAERLLKYYSVRNPTQANPEAIANVMTKFEKFGYPKMWEMLLEKYGPEPSAATPNPNLNALFGSAILPRPMPAPPVKIITVPPGAFVNRTCVVRAELRFFGADYQLYERSQVDTRAAFRLAIETDVAQNINVDSNQVRVTQLSAPGLIVSVEIELVNSQDWQVMSEILTRKVHNGTYTMSNVRAAYQRELGGNAYHLHHAMLAILQRDRNCKHVLPVRE